MEKLIFRKVIQQLLYVPLERNTGSPRLMAICLVTVRTYDSAGKNDLQPVLTLTTAKASLWSWDHNLGTWQPVWLYDRHSVPWSRDYHCRPPWLASGKKNQWETA